MGRVRTKSKRVGRAAVEGIVSEKKADPSIESLLAKAYELVTQCEYDLAQKFVKRVREKKDTIHW